LSQEVNSTASRLRLQLLVSRPFVTALETHINCGVGTALAYWLLCLSFLLCS